MADLNVSIEDHWINTFSDTVYKLTTQTAAKLRPVVDFEPLMGQKKFFDRVGSAEVQNLNARHPEIIPSDLLWDRRMVTSDRKGVAFFTDQRDIQRVLTDPKSIYAQRAAEALERDLDRCIYAAFDATVYTGQNGTTSVSAGTDGVQTVTATSGFTYDTLLEIDANFQKYEIDNIRKFLVISDQEHTQLMKEAELINRDFTDRAVVDNGQLTRVMDFEIIRFGSAMATPMLSVASSVRKCFAVAQGAVKVGMPGTWDIKWQPRNDRWDTDQLLARGERGAVRMEGSRIQIVNTTAS
jgi:hypothetical protein